MGILKLLTQNRNCWHLRKYLTSGRFFRHFSGPLAIICILPLSNADAQTIQFTTMAPIAQLTGGWNSPDMFVRLDGQTASTIINPGNCTTTDGYELSGSDPHYQIVSSMLLTAYASQLNVQLVITGCYGNRPHIVGINFIR